MAAKKHCLFVANRNNGKKAMNAHVWNSYERMNEKKVIGKEREVFKRRSPWLSLFLL